MSPLLPILNYHGIELRRGEYPWLQEETPYVILTDSFEFQLDYIANEGFTTLSEAGLGTWLDGKSSVRKPIMLTFDDGHISHLDHVMRALTGRQMKGLFFVPVAHVGQPGHLDWSQLKEILAAGFEIGSHGYRHIPLSALTHHELWKETQKSKKILEDKLGLEIKSYSVPRGFYQLRIREVTMELGFKFVFTSRFDVNQPGQDPWRLNRIAVKKNLGFKDFTRFVSGDLGYKRLVERAKEGLRRFVRPDIYDALANFKRNLTHG
ncbi:MAG: polysaccharide deacetylase family protein [Candidatus Omnitrophica bacterium]|nr:polysaccharide deacetylase family protein [Candidatus Omnitrophota bacterium]